MKIKQVEVETYCWNCGEQDTEIYFQCSPYNKNMGSTCCAACGQRRYALWLDLLELHDRQYNRNIPRL